MFEKPTRAWDKEALEQLAQFEEMVKTKDGLTTVIPHGEHKGETIEWSWGDITLRDLKECYRYFAVVDDYVLALEYDGYTIFHIKRTIQHKVVTAIYNWLEMQQYRIAKHITRRKLYKSLE